jgi:hypothetical protein
MYIGTPRTPSDPTSRRTHVPRAGAKALHEEDAEKSAAAAATSRVNKRAMVVFEVVVNRIDSELEGSFE